MEEDHRCDRRTKKVAEDSGSHRQRDARYLPRPPRPAGSVRQGLRAPKSFLEFTLIFSQALFRPSSAPSSAPDPRQIFRIERCLW